MYEFKRTYPFGKNDLRIGKKAVIYLMRKAINCINTSLI
jgi:hypothetical protein